MNFPKAEWGEVQARPGVSSKAALILGRQQAATPAERIPSAVDPPQVFKGVYFVRNRTCWEAHVVLVRRRRWGCLLLCFFWQRRY